MVIVTKLNSLIRIWYRAETIDKFAKLTEPIGYTEGKLTDYSNQLWLDKIGWNSVDSTPVGLQCSSRPLGFPS